MSILKCLNGLASGLVSCAIELVFQVQLCHYCPFTFLLLDIKLLRLLLTGYFKLETLASTKIHSTKCAQNTDNLFSFMMRLEGQYDDEGAMSI